MTIDLEAIVARSTKLRPSTKRKYAAIARKWAEFAGADPGSWTTLRAQDFYDWLINPAGGKPKVNSASAQLRGLQYISRRYSLLHQGLDFADGVELARGGERANREALSLEQAKSLLATCTYGDPNAIRDRAILVLGLTTGARRESIGSVDMGGFSVVAPNVGLPFQATAMDMKGGYSYQVPINRYVVAACDEWRQWLGNNGITSGPFFRSVSLPDVRGRRRIGRAALTGDGIYKMLQKRAGQAGIGDCHPHILRHTFVTWMRAAGVPPEHIAAITSHATGEDGGRSTVMERVYFHKEAVAGAALASVESVFAPLF